MSRWKQAKKGQMVDMFCRNVWTAEGPAIHIKMKGVETAISPEDAKSFAQLILQKANDATSEGRLAVYLVNELGLEPERAADFLTDFCGHDNKEVEEWASTL